MVVHSSNLVLVEMRAVLDLGVSLKFWAPLGNGKVEAEDLGSVSGSYPSFYFHYFFFYYFFHYFYFASTTTSGSTASAETTITTTT